MTATRPPGYDDRSAAPVEASRRGAHRARPKAIAAILPVIAGVAVVLLVIGATYTVLGNKSDTQTNTTAQKALEDEAGSGEATASASAGADDSDDSGADADSGDAAATPATEDTTTAADDTDAATGTVDQTIPVVVLNSIDVAGLAAEKAAELENQGWTVERTGNSNNKDLPKTKIYYGSADIKASAQAVRKALGGIGQLSENADVTSDITVVIGFDGQ
ncbi:LytR C-terminal domain-containing protein [Kineosporia sp. J2-2]|uniref:LytR C-terminal domain-containing protein n=1 Tax=Kineosporia corallincola TaxID=2835133 RepID=A0ABS5T8Q3_9ACTN|nr:LytR C-terminal domain-containing protein [Kineosporia corallincola]MBT0767455.1 LytR C-terminal domain-containing protein [Kineosporia corallincola]